MANEIVAVSSRSGNLVSTIAYLIEATLQERCDLSSESNAIYLQQLATLTGLGFTAVLAEGSHIRPYRPHFATFLRYRDFTEHTDKFEPISHAIAEMVCSAFCPFKQLGHPRYYDDFINALVNVLTSSNTSDTEGRKGIKNMLQELLKQHN